MIQEQVIDRGVTDSRVIEALRAVPREKFFAADQREDVYADRASPIGHEQTISQPFIVAIMTEKLKLTGSETVLEVGTGSGYQTAILCRLAKEVFSLERIKPLLDAAFERLLDLGCRNVHFKLGDGSLGWPVTDSTPKTFDRILIAAAMPTVPEQLLRSQLADGGIAILPVGEAREQMLVKIEKHGDKLKRSDLIAVRFVPLIGDAGYDAPRN